MTNTHVDPNLTKPKKQAHYGTAGYRLATDDLNNVLCRASLIANIRSATFGGKYIGLYITASHNPIEYNGIKFIDSDGNMLDEEWEKESDRLVNCEDGEFDQIVEEIYKKMGGSNVNITGNVIIGRDTRDSGTTISKNIMKVLAKYKCNVFDYGTVSCPEIHFLIRKSNESGKIVDKSLYIDTLYENYCKLRQLTGTDLPMGLDTASGVGKNCIDSIFERDSSFSLEVLNGSNGILNKDCGADFIKTKKKAPHLKKSPHELCASFDGDVDRLIFYTEKDEVFDGDAQCVLIAEKIKESLKTKASIGVVLSHYSNMGAMNYLKEKGFEVVLAQTGVKNFVKKAKEYDIGIYFEPNGHGSVKFSQKFLESLNDSNTILGCLTRMFDPCIGDALANLLIFKALVKSKKDFQRYKENHSKLMTVKIENKTSLKVDVENRVLSPNIQGEIELLAKKYEGRAFVRPSGTEDLVRVFAECLDEKNCERLAVEVAKIVYENCKGVGPKPE